MSLHNDIAAAIQKADSSYFFENYTKQASAVVQTLDKKGYVTAPKEPTQAMIEAGVEAITTGKVKPEELVKQLYVAMIAAARK